MSAPSIDIVIGTKAQYIKSAPLLRLLDSRGVHYRLIDTGQHAGLAPALRRELGIRPPDYQFSSTGNVKSVREAMAWAARIVSLIVFRPSRLRNKVFQPGSGVCVIHGDTPSTFLALLMAKRAGKQVAHLEAGLRSYNLLRPFPEELIRIVCMKWSDLLFAPSAWAMGNLRRLGVSGRCVELPQNTNVEALHFALSRGTHPAAVARPYSVATIHRVETIHSKARLAFAVGTVLKAAEQRKVVFVLHDPTLRRLRRYGLYDRLAKSSNVEMLSLLTHSEFVSLLSTAEFVITDGGSIQEESHYLDVPCLVMRSETERNEGLGTNVRICSFSEDTADDFLLLYPSLRHGRPMENLRPSETILAELLSSGLSPSKADGLRTYRNS